MLDRYESGHLILKHGSKSLGGMLAKDMLHVDGLTRLSRIGRKLYGR
jgi:hypothetical protein